MTSTHPGRRARRPSRDGESGSIIPLIAWYLALLIALVVVVVDVTAVQLARARLYDVADVLALDAADAISESALFREGVGTTVPVSDDTVRAAARRLLDAQERPPNVASWQLGDETGAEPDPGADPGSTTGAGAVVTLTGRVEVPMASGMLDALGGSVTLTVRSRAQAWVTPPNPSGSTGFTTAPPHRTPPKRIPPTPPTPPTPADTRRHHRHRRHPPTPADTVDLLHTAHRKGPSSSASTGSNRPGTPTGSTRPTSRSSGSSLDRVTGLSPCPGLGRTGDLTRG